VSLGPPEYEAGVSHPALGLTEPPGDSCATIKFSRAAAINVYYCFFKVG
jgi:hypothetical protein